MKIILGCGKTRSCYWLLLLSALLSDGLSLTPRRPPGGGAIARPHSAGIVAAFCVAWTDPYSGCRGEKYAIRLSLRVTSGCRNGGNCWDERQKTVGWTNHKRNNGHNDVTGRNFTSMKIQQDDRTQRTVTSETVSHAYAQTAWSEEPDGPTPDTDIDTERVSIAVTLFIPIREALRSNLDCGIRSWLAGLVVFLSTSSQIQG
jgi:hypothetical protein